MKIQTTHRSIYKITTIITDINPAAGSHIVNILTNAILCNPYNLAYRMKMSISRLQKLESINRILVICDLNIGDAVNLQSVIMALRDYFADVDIDYAINKKAVDFIQGNSDISMVIPAFTGSHFPFEKDIQLLEQIILDFHYDIIFNFCPSINVGQSVLKRKWITGYLPLSGRIIYDGADADTNIHVAWKAYQYIHELFSTWLKPVREPEFKGISIQLSDLAIQEAWEFLQQKDLLCSERLIYYNPDASSRFSRIPLSLQISLLKHLMEFRGNMIMAPGFTERNIELALVDTVSAKDRDRIAIIPKMMPLASYAALIDLADVYISGDCGPMHIAAARKYSESNLYKTRNKTVIISIFGAAAPRIYGYDSEQPGFQPASQDAPSRVFVAGSACRNYSCVNKQAKTCQAVRCFDVLNTKNIAAEIQTCLNEMASSRLTNYQMEKSVLHTHRANQVIH